jgi:hypothetical protein
VRETLISHSLNPNKIIIANYFNGFKAQGYFFLSYLNTSLNVLTKFKEDLPSLLFYV